jgi:hypothetical protein
MFTQAIVSFGSQVCQRQCGLSVFTGQDKDKSQLFEKERVGTTLSEATLSSHSESVIATNQHDGSRAVDAHSYLHNTKVRSILPMLSLLSRNINHATLRTQAGRHPGN